MITLIKHTMNDNVNLESRYMNYPIFQCSKDMHFFQWCRSHCQIGATSATYDIGSRDTF